MSTASNLPPDDLPESLLLALGAAVKPAELAKEQRDRMRGKVLERARSSGPDGTSTWRATGSSWITIAPMVEIRELFRDAQRGTHTSLLRMRPGGTILPHRHEQEEEFIVLEGDCHIGTHHLGPGDAHVAGAGSWHDRVTTPNGVLVLIKGEYPYPRETPAPAAMSAGR